MKATSIFSEIVMHFLSEQFGINARERRPSFFITPAHNKACLKDAGSLQSLSTSALQVAKATLTGTGPGHACQHQAQDRPALRHRRRGPEEQGPCKAPIQARKSIASTFSPSRAPIARRRPPTTRCRRPKHTVATCR